MKDIESTDSGLSEHAMLEASIYKNFRDRSEVSQEIISQKLNFFERWSLVLFLMVLLVLAFSSWFIKYPDVIEGRAVLVAENAPKEIIPKMSGKLTALFIKNNQKVKEKEIIGWLESNANTQEVIDLSTKLEIAFEYIRKRNPSDLYLLFKSPYTRLGELQPAYQAFVIELQKYYDYSVNGFFSHRKDMLYSDIFALDSIKSQNTIKKKITEKNYELALKTFEMYEVLYKEKIISLEEYRQAKIKLLENEESIPQSNVTVISQQSLIREKQKEIEQLNHDIVQQKISFEQSLQTLKSNVDDWLRKYTLQSPADGRIVFALPLQANQHITEGRLLGYVNPPDSSYFGELLLSQNNFGKVDTGMRVQLRLDAYPYQENGYVQGKVVYISDIAIDSGFICLVELDKGLITNQKRGIRYKNGLTAKGLVITKEMRLLERLFYAISNISSLH